MAGRLRMEAGQTHHRRAIEIFRCRILPPPDRMNDVPGHSWELRHEDAPYNLGDRQAVLFCVDCKMTVMTRHIQAYRKFSFRDREALSQAWAVHLAAAKIKVERWPDSDLLPY